MASVAPPIRTLSEVLDTIESAPWNHALYLASDEVWHAETRCAILDPDDSDDPNADADPPFAEEHGLSYALSVHDTQGIVDNARQQKPDATTTELIEAFNFYYDNDAFIAW